MEEEGGGDLLYDDLMAPAGHQGTLLQSELDAVREENVEQKRQLAAALELQQSLAAEVRGQRYMARRSVVCIPARHGVSSGSSRQQTMS